MSKDFADFSLSYDSICKIEIVRHKYAIEIKLHRRNSEQGEFVGLWVQPDSDPPEIVIDERLGDWHQHDVVR